jgi:hypothetical protein
MPTNPSDIFNGPWFAALTGSSGTLALRLPMA